MRHIRIPVATLAVTTALVLGCAGLASGAPVDDDGEHIEVGTDDEAAPRGGDIQFRADIPWGVDKPRRVVFESPALPHGYPVDQKHFGASKDDDAIPEVLVHLPCDIKPGTYPVTVRTSGRKRPTDPGKFRVTSDIAPRCKDRTGSDTERLAPGVAVELSHKAPQDPQRGSWVTFTIRADLRTLRLDDYLILRSPAFVRPVRRKTSGFRTLPGQLASPIEALVDCATKPGSYLVEVVREHGGGKPLAATVFTVPERMDQSHRDYCAKPRKYPEPVERTSEEDPQEDPPPVHGLGPGAVAGIAAGSTLLGAAGGAWLMAWRRRRAQRADEPR
ncbi:hypothetical protein ACIHFE_22670 [Streptomyces sp. NPDC052396]|uniref:hypothetical protein n=1 Tax=Streptomyces sp. NPDC052396 TaxID=3365689 RepID=UPI0037CEA518